VCWALGFIFFAGVKTMLLVWGREEGVLKVRNGVFKTLIGRGVG